MMTLWKCRAYVMGAGSGVARIAIASPIAGPLSSEDFSVTGSMFPQGQHATGFPSDLYYNKLMISQTQTDQQSRDLSPAVHG